MSFTKLSNQQLFNIAMDADSRLIERYAAARELQKRRKENEICRNRSKHDDRVCGTE